MDMKGDDHFKDAETESGSRFIYLNKAVFHLWCRLTNI